MNNTASSKVVAIGGGKRINKTTYDEMYAAYTARQSARYIAEQCGVSRETAQRAITRGYRSRGWPALKTRLADVHRKAAEQEDYDLVEAHRETLRALV